MSVATPFTVFPPKPFPFCAQNIAANVDAQANYLGNLPLANVMSFAWNLETFTLRTYGSASDGVVADGNSTFTLAPIASNRFTGAPLVDGTMWFGAAFANIAFASWPSIRTPRARVCLPNQNAAGCLFDINLTGAPEISGEIGFWVGTDPSNPGKYRLYYRFDLDFTDPGTSTVEIFWDNRPTIPGVTAFANGNITLGAEVFPWYSYYSTGDTPSGNGVMTATSTSYTY